ncbi:hypothetical protein LguiB_032663 [Lonicera macranthoides]
MVVLRYSNMSPCAICILTNRSMVMQEEEKTNYYQLLALSSKNVGFEDIKRAYRNMALRLHPDVCSSLTKEESTRRFVELQKAYNTLSDPNLRQIYDNELSLVGNRERRGSFSKDVWERQLNGLSKRSCDRMERERKMELRKMIVCLFFACS